MRSKYKYTEAGATAEAFSASASRPTSFHLGRTPDKVCIALEIVVNTLVNGRRWHGHLTGTTKSNNTYCNIFQKAIGFPIRNNDF